MSEFLPDGSVTSPKGFLAAGTACGIKAAGYDLAVLYSELPCAAAAVFTTNKVKAAPVFVSQRHLANGRAQAVIINSGNANAGTGDDGLAKAEEMARLLADRLGIAADDVLVSSTGEIGVYLPIEKIRDGVKSIEPRRDGGHLVARAIMTTDTRPKEAACTVQLGSVTATIGGMTKGAGMIHPNMATMLCYITTDAAVEPSFLQAALRRAVNDSFNMISIDGDSSTNDTVAVLANGAAGNEVIAEGSPYAGAFESALRDVATSLAKQIARDGEGATRLIEVTVAGAASTDDARLAARTVVSSNLVKSAVYGADPNWGRILAAIGRSGAAVDQNRVDIFIGDLALMRQGIIQPFDKVFASSLLKTPEVFLKADLHLGDGSATAWGCDLTEEYVVINSAYTT